MIDINWLAAIVAGILGFLPGAVWYSPVLFLNQWKTDTGLSGEGGSIPFPVRLVAGMLLSTIAALLFALLIGPRPDLELALLWALGVALGFITTSFAIQYLFEGKPMRLTLINGGYHLVQFVIFALVLGLWP